MPIFCLELLKTQLLGLEYNIRPICKKLHKCVLNKIHLKFCYFQMVIFILRMVSSEWIFIQLFIYSVTSHLTLEMPKFKRQKDLASVSITNLNYILSAEICSVTKVASGIGYDTYRMFESHNSVETSACNRCLLMHF